MKRGNKLVGFGMATGVWDAYQFPSRVKAIITKDRKLKINSPLSMKISVNMLTLIWLNTIFPPTRTFTDWKLYLLMKKMS